MIEKSDIENRPKKLISTFYLDSECKRALMRMASKEKLSLPNMINHCLVDYLLNKKKLS